MNVEYIQTLEDVAVAPDLQHDPDQLLEEVSLQINQYYGDREFCELQDADTECSHDGILWGADDFGSPYFCTEHFFPQEQLGYEFVENVLNNERVSA